MTADNATFYILATLYILFALWHYRFFNRSLSPTDVAEYMRIVRQGEDFFSEQEGDNLENFLSTDDGRSFYMVNLMEYKEKADYPEGMFPEVETGQQANMLYSKGIVPALIKRGGYPIFLSKKIGHFLTPGGDYDFFQEVGIVRYRSRRDFIAMATKPGMEKLGIHKFASMEKTVVVPTRRMLVIDLGLIVPLVLILVGLLVTR